MSLFDAAVNKAKEATGQDVSNFDKAVQRIKNEAPGNAQDRLGDAVADASDESKKDNTENQSLI